MLCRREPLHGTEIGDQRRGRLDSDPGDRQEAAHPGIALGATAKLPIELLDVSVQLGLQGEAVLARELKAALQRYLGQEGLAARTEEPDWFPGGDRLATRAWSAFLT